MTENMVSIIVPVYNAEKYIKKCVESMVSQTYKNFEIILVNDGSTDKSIEICNLHSQSHKEIRIINQKNQGPSKARNEGIKSARGKFILFIDADDFIEPNMISRMLEEINGNDLVICNYKIHYFNNKEEKIKINNLRLTTKEFNDLKLDFFPLYQSNMINPLWNKLYKTNIIQENNIEFRSGIHMGEDLIFNLEYLKNAKSISVIDECLYNYNIINTDSLTHIYKSNYFENQEMLFNEIKEFMIEKNIFTGENHKLYEIIYTKNILNCIDHIFHDGNPSSKKEKETDIQVVLSNKNVRELIIRNDSRDFQQKIVSILIKYKLEKFIYLYFQTKRTYRNLKKSM